MGDIKDQKLDNQVLKGAAGGKKGPLVRVTCPRCGTKWEMNVYALNVQCPKFGCAYIFSLDNPCYVEVLETYDD